MASIYGDGSDGDLEVTSGIYNLDLNRKYQFSSVNIHSGATLSTASTTGAVLYISCSGTFTLDGTINVSNRVTYGDNSWEVVIDGDTYDSPGVARGGSGANNGGAPALGFGGGGGGQSIYQVHGGYGGSGGTAPVAGASVTASRSAAGTTQVNGNNGSSSGGGSGSAYVELDQSQSGSTLQAISGAGASAYGARGGSGNVQISGNGVIGGNFTALAGGGGGGGGRAGRAGVHVVIKAKTLILNGTIITSGTSGQKGGDGGSGYQYLVESGVVGSGAFSEGSGGGGGGGGNAGNITLVYQDSLTDVATKTMDGGSAGAGGAGGLSGDAGLAGSAGTVSTTMLIELEAQFTAVPTSGLAPLSVRFTDTSIGSPTSWNWDFGDGGTSTTQNPTHTYATAGAFTVTLTVSNATTIDTASQVIDVVVDVSPNGTAVSVHAGSPTIEHSPPPPPPPADWSALGREDKKEYLYKVYDSAGNFIGVWTDVVDEPQFSQQINTPGTTMTVQLGRSANTTKEVRNLLISQDGKQLITQDGNSLVVTGQTSNTVGEGTDIDLNYNVDIYVQYGGFNNLITQDGTLLVTQDGNQLVVSFGSPLGTRIFSGYIMDYTSSYGDQTGVTVTLSSNGAELSQEVIRSGAVTTVTYNSAPLESIAKSVLDTNPGKMSYDSSSIGVTGVSQTVTFQLNTKLEAIQSVYNQTPDGWYWFGNVADNLLYLKAASTTPDHVFYLGQHIKSVDVKRSIESLVNAVWFVGGQTNPSDPTTTVFHYYEDATSQTAWRKGIDRITDRRYLLTSSMQARAMKEIGKYKGPIFTMPVTISAGHYDIETIYLGQMVGFANFGNFIDGLVLQIVSLSYTPTAVTLQLGQLQDRQVDIVNDIQDGLQNDQFQAIPTQPT